MKHKLLIIFALISFRTYAICENISSFELQSEHVKYEPSSVFITSEGRAFLYAYPFNECASKLFIINKDKVISYASYKNFRYINYINKKGVVISGWIKSSQIGLPKEKINHLKVNENDFFIYSNGTEIHLNSDYANVAKKLFLYKDSTINNTFMNEFRAINGVDYKFYPHDFGSLYIESSNLNYDKENRDFDDYRITKIIIDNQDRFSVSSRGISLGSKISDVLKVYGKPEGDRENQHKIQYRHKNMSIIFIGDSVIERIELEMHPI